MPAPPNRWDTLSVDELEEALRYHNQKYWIDDAPEISDPDYDHLVETLRERRPDSPLLEAIGIAGAEDEAEGTHGPLVHHDPPMLSLDKCYEEETLLKWFDKFEGDAIVSPKIDGVAVCIKYDGQGRLLFAATRGNGKVGELITDQVRQIVDVPEQIDAGPLEVRGEAYMPRDIFDREFKVKNYMSPRNLTAGALKLKDPTKVADYKIHFFGYDVIGKHFPSEQAKLEFVRAQGFSPLPYELVTHAALQSTYDRLAGQRQDWNYETDGVVYKVNDTSLQEGMGRTAHHPRFAIAYKFQGDSGRSTLRQVVWNVSRTGAINPVGIVDPVELSGARVTRVSLHNLAIMEGLGGPEGLRLGACVVMMRRGGVIPNMEAVITPGEDPVEIPGHCPICLAPTHRKGDVLFADHTASCRPMRVSQLAHFTKVMGIKGFGARILEQAFDEGLLLSPLDLYTLDAATLESLDRMGQKLATKLVAQIDASRTPPAQTFLCALGIPELGRHVSAILATHCASIDEVFALSPHQLAAIHTIGDIIADHVTQGLAERRQEITALLEHVTPRFGGQTAQEEDFPPSDRPLSGKQVLFTGTLSTMSRKDAQDAVLAQGGRCPSSVTTSLDYLVVGAQDFARYQAGWRSSKLKRAEQLIAQGSPMAIVGETDFMALLAEENSVSNP